MGKTALVIVIVAFAGICLGVYSYVCTVEPFRDKWRSGRRAFTLPVATSSMVIAAVLTIAGH